MNFEAILVTDAIDSGDKVYISLVGKNHRQETFECIRVLAVLHEESSTEDIAKAACEHARKLGIGIVHEA